MTATRSNRSHSEFPEPWLSVYAERRDAIKRRLEYFAQIPREHYFYELLFCILTPQSQAKNAEIVISKLIDEHFFEIGFDPTEILRNSRHYIRFHNTKARRLLIARKQFSAIAAVIDKYWNKPIVLREEVREAVPGFGLKESSHFLRNIGIRGLAILDRHILKHLNDLKIIRNIPASLTDKRYYAIEKKWKKYSGNIGISLDELDLLFWSMETGEIRK
ncbi:MAG TPA: DNA lyase [Candidatus Kapabacteria bacterium]|nr:DNA lyase [Candidatus Kapabacteria bacterium]